jgi:hypothetical protein
MILHSLLVGAYHRPPAKQVLAHLPAGAELILRKEPENPYDAGAIKVLVGLKYVLPEGQKGALDEALTGTGTDLVELLAAEEPLQLGYIIAPTNKKLGHWASNLAVGELMDRGLYVARLMFTPEGEPTVVTELVEDPAEDPEDAH